MDRNNLRLKLFNDFIMSKNHITNFVVQGCPIRENVLVYLNEFTFNDTSLEEDMILLTNAENENNYKIKIKIEDFAELLVPKFTNKEFKSHFRVNRSSIEVVMTFIGPALSQKSIKINVEKQILIFIWYMANCETHRQIGNRFNIAESTSHDIITNCLLAMNDVAGKIIVWPTGVAALENIQKFNSLRGLNSFPNVFGCIDGCHINTLFPWEKRTKMPKLDRNMFCNRKQVPSVVLQGIVDAEMKFIDVFAGWPGRSHDARIFRCSTIGQTIINTPSSILPNSCYILGDGAYPLAEGLMIPYKDNGNLSLKQKNFNHKLSSSRVLIEQAFGKLICRFRKIKHMDLYKKNFCGKVITAACCLHNICISNNDTFVADVPIQTELNLQEIRNEVISGATKRNLICDTLSMN